MEIKWIVTDMDGTLLDGRDRITEKTKTALLACQRKGIRLILASGRSYARLLPYAEELRLKEFGGCLIEVNGLALNRLGEGKRQVFAQLKREDKELLLAKLKSFQTEIQGYQDEGLYYWIPDWMRPIKEKERDQKGYPSDHPLMGGPWSWVSCERHSYPLIQELSALEEMPDTLNKLNCADSPKRIRKIYASLKERFEDRYEIVCTDARNIDILPRGISKGDTLHRFMEEESIRPEEIIAFGDGENDISLFRAVSYGIAMGNAEDYVKKEAIYVTESNEEDGIAKALEKYGLF